MWWCSANRLYSLMLLCLLCVPAAVVAVPDESQQRIIAVVQEPEVQDTAPSQPAVLLAFREHPDDLQVVADLDKHSDAVLAYAEQRMAVTEPAISSDKAGELLLALSLIRDERAQAALLALASRFQNEIELSQQVLLMLRDMPVTEPVLVYVDNLIKSGRKSRGVDLVRSSLLYYLAVKSQAGMRWAAVYRSPGMNPQLRFAGLALAASLTRDDQVTRWILRELTKQPAVARYQQYYLLAALYASVTEEEYDQLLPRFTVTPVAVKEFQRLRDFNQASDAEKNRLAGFMLVSPYLDQQQTALKYFLQQHTMMDIWPRLSTTLRLSAIRLSHTLGLSIAPEPGVVNEPAPARAGLPLVYILGLLLLGVLAGAFLYRRMRSKQSLKEV